MFHLKELNRSISELAAHADNLKLKADQVSDDIKNLEKYLNEKFIGLEVGLNIQDHTIDETHMKMFELAGMGTDLKFLLREFLNWKRDTSTQKFRLMYETHSLKGDKTTGYQIYPEAKPLIECPLFDRLRMHPHLPRLLDHIGALLASIK